MLLQIENGDVDGAEKELTRRILMRARGYACETGVSLEHILTDCEIVPELQRQYHREVADDDEMDTDYDNDDDDVHAEIGEYTILISSRSHLCIGARELGVLIRGSSVRVGRRGGHHDRIIAFIDDTPVDHTATFNVFVDNGDAEHVTAFYGVYNDLRNIHNLRTVSTWQTSIRRYFKNVGSVIRHLAASDKYECTGTRLMYYTKMHVDTFEGTIKCIREEFAFQICKFAMDSDEEETVAPAPTN